MTAMISTACVGKEIFCFQCSCQEFMLPWMHDAQVLQMLLWNCSSIQSYLGQKTKWLLTGDICFLVRVQLSESYLCARHFTAHDFFYLIYIDKSMQQLPETMLAAELSYVFLSRFHFQI